MVSTPRKDRGPSLSGKVAIVTGGASGIGRETALLFAQEGASVTIVDLDSEGGQKTVQDIKHEGFHSLFVQTDVTSEPDCKKAIKMTVSQFGQLDILFNNAGVAPQEASFNIWDLSLNDWEWGMKVNVWGVIHGIKAFLPSML
ncbi:MAG: SDR family oxidoreductase, partial [Acidobacteriota bacterium]|nr:SDR family oxidoreductase [Acidobacteriota bacterium]